MAVGGIGKGGGEGERTWPCCSAPALLVIQGRGSACAPRNMVCLGVRLIAACATRCIAMIINTMACRQNVDAAAAAVAPPCATVSLHA